MGHFLSSTSRVPYMLMCVLQCVSLFLCFLEHMSVCELFHSVNMQPCAGRGDMEMLGASALGSCWMQCACGGEERRG